MPVRVRQIGQGARISSGVYSVPSSVAWEIETTRGWTACSSPTRAISALDRLRGELSVPAPAPSAA